MKEKDEIIKKLESKANELSYEKERSEGKAT